MNVNLLILWMVGSIIGSDAVLGAGYGFDEGVVGVGVDDGADGDGGDNGGDNGGGGAEEGGSSGRE